MTTCYTNGTTTNGFNAPYGTPNGYGAPFQNGFPNGCQGNACPDYSGNGCCMTNGASWNGASWNGASWNGTACGPTSYAWTPSTYAQAQTPWQSTPWGAAPQSPWGTPTAPWQNQWSGQSQWNAACGPQWTPWNSPTPTPWQGAFNGWNTPWTNQWSTPNAPFAQWNSQPFSQQPWGTPWATASSPFNGFSGFSGPQTNGAWCCVPTFTPWGLCFTTVPSSVYASMLAGCTSQPMSGFSNPFQGQTAPQWMNPSWTNSAWTNSAWTNPAWSNSGWNTPNWNASTWNNASWQNGPSWQNASPSTPWSNGWTGQSPMHPMNSAWNGGHWNAPSPTNAGWNNAGYSNTGYSNPGYSNPGYSNPGYNNPGWNTPTPTPSNWNGGQRPVFNNANGCTPNSGFTGNATNGCASGFAAAPSNYSNTGKPFPATPTSGQPISPAAPGAVYGGPNGAPQQYAAPVCQVPATMMAESACCSGGARNAA